MVVRRLGKFSKGEEITGLLTYLEDPLPSTTLVLVWEQSQRAVGPLAPDPAHPHQGRHRRRRRDRRHRRPLGPGFGRVGGRAAPGRRPAGRPRVRQEITDTLGEDAGALVGVIERLKGAFSPGSRLSLDDVAPYLGPSGGVPPWELTDAIDSGDVTLALDKLQRMMGSGDRHPLAIMATLQSHYTRMLRLDGAGVRGEKEAAQVLGLKGSTFPAKKALAQGKKLGGPGVRRAVACWPPPMSTSAVRGRGRASW